MRTRNTPRKPPQTAGEVALRADRRTLAELSRILGVSKMTISRWARGVDIPDDVNQLLLQTRLGIAAELWRLCPEAAPTPEPIAALPAAVAPAAVAPVRLVEPAEPEPTAAPKPPEPPHYEGPHRLPGEDFRAALTRREAWRVQWQAAWLDNWHRAHPNVPRDLAAEAARLRAEGCLTSEQRAIATRYASNGT